MRLGLCLLVGCTEPAVFIGDHAYGSLTDAADAAVPGDVLTFATVGPLVAEVDLPDDVTVRGPITLTGLDGSVLTSDGHLTLVDVDLQGHAPESPLLRLGSLTATHGAWTRDGPPETPALAIGGDVTITGTSVRADGEILFARRAVGRPAQVTLVDTELVGTLTVEADRLVLDGVGGAVHADLEGADVEVVDSGLRSLEVRGTDSRLIGLAVEGAAASTAASTTLLDVSGGTWQIDSDRIVGNDVAVAGLGGSPREVDLFDVTADLIQFTHADRIDAKRIHGELVYLTGDAVTTEEVTAHQVAFAGPGDHRTLTLRGRRPRLTASLCSLTSVLMTSDQEAVVLELEAANIDNLVVIEPAGAEATYLVDTSTYATLQHVSWLGGRRAKTTPRFAQLAVGSSLFAMEDFGAIEQWTWFQDTIVASTEDVVAGNGLLLGDPGFTGPTDPRLLPTAEWPQLGAFAGPHGPKTLERFVAQP